MKKIIFILLFSVLTFTTNAQEFSAGLSAGIPTGDAGDLYTFSLVLDVHAHWEVSEGFNAGVATGYINSFGDDIDLGEFGTGEVEDAGFIPIAASGRYRISEQFSFGADVGYALGVAPDGNDGGFYYAPKAIYGISENLNLVGAYRSVSRDGSSFDNFTFGVEYSFN